MEINNETIDEIIEKGRTIDSFSFSHETRDLSTRDLGEGEVRISSNRNGKITEHQIFAMSLELGHVSQISLNANPTDRFGVRSYDVNFVENNENTEGLGDKKDVVLLESFGHSRLTGCRGSNVFILENPTNLFRGSVDISEMDGAVNWINEKGLEVASKTPISTFVQSDQLNVRSWAFVTRKV